MNKLPNVEDFVASKDPEVFTGWESAFLPSSVENMLREYGRIVRDITLEINYIRSCFCKHDWYTEDIYYHKDDGWGGWRKGKKVYMRCKKCGYHTRHWKV